MSKYSKLTDSIMQKKINAFLQTDISDELKEEIRLLNSSFDRQKSEELCDKVELLLKEIKDRKKREENEEKFKTESYEEYKKEPEKEYDTIITKDEFSVIKDSFGIMKKDENENEIFSSLHEQFLNEMRKYPQLKLYIVSYNEASTYNIDKLFIHKNFNIMLPDRFDYIRKISFTCFRFTTNPLTNKCIYISYWIVNSPIPLYDLFKDDDQETSFNISEYLGSIEEFCNNFMKSESPIIIDERYLR